MAGGAISVEGERTAQGIGDDFIHTGAKSFGGSIPFSEGNPNINSSNNFKITGLIVGGFIIGLIVWKKVK